MAESDELRGLKILIYARMEDAFERWSHREPKEDIMFAAQRLMERDEITEREKELVTQMCRARTKDAVAEASFDLFKLHQDLGLIDSDPPVSISSEIIET